MQQTKYFIEGNAAAHAGQIRACRYNKEENRREWFAGPGPGLYWWRQAMPGSRRYPATGGPRRAICDL